MDGEGQERIVYFDICCPKCLNRNCDADEDPCRTCLDTSVNIDSHDGVNYKPDPKIVGKNPRVKPPKRR